MSDETGQAILVGRAPVKVSLENGAIAKGDYLTASSIPGIAMKATEPCQVIGKALEDFDGKATTELIPAGQKITVSQLKLQNKRSRT